MVGMARDASYPAQLITGNQGEVPEMPYLKRFVEAESPLLITSRPESKEDDLALYQSHVNKGHILIVPTYSDEISQYENMSEGKTGAHLRTGWIHYRDESLRVSTNTQNIIDHMTLIEGETLVTGTKVSPDVNPRETFPADLYKPLSHSFFTIPIRTTSEGSR